MAAIKSLDGMVACYNQMAHRLKLVPASAKRADGVTFELRTNREAGHVSEFSNIDLKVGRRLLSLSRKVQTFTQGLSMCQRVQVGKIADNPACSLQTERETEASIKVRLGDVQRAHTPCWLGRHCLCIQVCNITRHQSDR